MSYINTYTLGNLYCFCIPAGLIWVSMFSILFCIASLCFNVNILEIPFTQDICHNPLSEKYIYKRKSIGLRYMLKCLKGKYKKPHRWKNSMNTIIFLF